MLAILLVVVLAVGLAAATYLGLEGLGRRAVVPASLRALAGIAIGLLVVNASCERPPESLRPIALLDASLSMGAAGSDWAAARALAASLGEVRVVGEIEPADSTPAGGRSRIAPDMLAAAATGRPVWLVTDGEVEDLSEIPADVLARVGVRVHPRAAASDLALTRADASERVAVGDTLRVEVEVSGFGVTERDAVRVEVRAGERVWLSGRVPLRNGSGTATLEGVLRDTPPGSYLAEIRLADANDQEPRTDVRFAVVAVTPTPGIVVVASPPGWESRFLFHALSEVAALPVRGYLGLAGGEWRRMGDFARVPPLEVEQAASRADLLVLLGDPPEAVRRARVRGRWEWPATSAAAAPAAGDWYLAATGASPVAGAFVGLPLDSFPPGVALATLSPGPGDWIGLNGMLNRRGVERPAVVGRDSAGQRQVAVGVAGLWRWAFRGGASEQAYRAWVAASTSWLLGGVDSVSGRARPVRAVAQRGRPIVFQRSRPDSAPLAITLDGPGGQRADTLRFDGQGRATLRLQPGSYRYRLAGGGSGLVAVEPFSDEWLRRPVALEPREAVTSPPPGRLPLRELPWLFGLAIAALSGEWWWRRRAGLR